MKELNLKVDGMKCGGCSARLQRVLEAIPQVMSCKADHVTKAVELVLKEDLPMDVITKAVEAAGFKVI
jgi:Cu+-exporting ATPase